jgi:transposase
MTALKKNADDFYNFKNYTQVSEEFAFYETEYEGRRCILTWSKVRSERDKKVRQDIINKLKKKLGKKTKSSDFVSNSNYKKFIKGLDGGEGLAINQQALDDEEKKDGYFGVITNIKKTAYTAQEITAQYKNLWIVEDAFGEIKGTLRARPIFHWTDHRIKGHLTMCYLAYFCEAQITKTFRHKKVMLESKAIEENEIESRPLTAVQFMKSLNSLRAIEIKIADKTLIKTTPIESITQKGLAALAIPLPEKTLKFVL